MVSTANSTLTAIRNKVRRLVASPSTSKLSDDLLDEYINTYYSQDMPSSLKLEKLRVEYKFYTTPNIDTYAVDKNLYQDVDCPVYVEGVESILYKDRTQFYRQWPQSLVSSIPATGDGTTDPISFTLSPVPFLRNSLLLWTTNVSGDVVKIIDDGAGGFVTTSGTAVVGSVNYITGAVSGLVIDPAVANGENINVWVYPYSATRPMAALYWQDQIILRPVPDGVYEISVEAYQTPTQFMATNSVPELNQWWQLIAAGAALRILQDRQDNDGVASVREVYEEQRGLALERDATNGIGVRNATIFSQPSNYPNYPWFW